MASGTIKTDYFGFSKDVRYNRYIKMDWSTVNCDVFKLQQALNTELDLQLSVDGFYGTGTENAVKRFQEKYGLVSDGSVGVKTKMQFKTLGYDVGYNHSTIRYSLKLASDTTNTIAVNLFYVSVQFNEDEENMMVIDNTEKNPVPTYKLSSPSIMDSNNKTEWVYVLEHNDNGTCDTNVKIHGIVNETKYDESFTNIITLTPNPAYALSVNTQGLVSVTVERTKCGAGSSGTLGVIDPSAVPEGYKLLYYGDLLKVTYNTDGFYVLLSSTINGNTFASGYTTPDISSDINISVISSQRPSLIQASDSFIEGSSSIIIKSYNVHYTHVLTYKYNEDDDIRGMIIDTGESKPLDYTGDDRYIKGHVIWNVSHYEGADKNFYSVIPDKRSAVCEIECATYLDDILVGTNSTTITTTVKDDLCIPLIQNVSINDNSTTTLTGGDALIYGVSDAIYSADISSLKYATISKVVLNEDEIEIEEGLYDYNLSKIFEKIQTSDFSLSVTDSRGYEKSISSSATIIPYNDIGLSLSAARKSSTDNNIYLQFNGTFFNNSFGLVDNDITISATYYNVTSPEDVITIDIPDSKWGVDGNSFKTINDGIDISNTSYEDSYRFVITASDKISTVVKEFTVPRGKPVFDWGKDDFNFNADVFVSNKSINILNNLNNVVVKLESDQNGGKLVIYNKNSQPVIECGCNSSGEGFIKLNGTDLQTS